MNRFLLLLVIACTGSGLPLVAQVYPFVNYTPRDGLIGNKVRFITQDSKGKLYFSTTNGLSIYDGSRFTNFSTANGLVNNLVNGIIESGNDSMLVILNSNKLQYIRNGKTGNISLTDSFCPVINQFFTCTNGDQYAFADEGLFRFENRRFKKVLLSGLPGLDGAKNLNHATEIDSLLIFSTDISNPAYKVPRLFIVYNRYTGKTITDASFPGIFYTVKTPQHDLILATEKGILSLDIAALKRGIIKIIPYSGPYAIPPGILGFTIYFDRQHNCWLTTDNGIWEFGPDKSVKFFSEQNGLPLDKASCIFQDREGTMWFGSDLTGVTKLVDQNLQFYKELNPGFFAYDLYITRGSDSIWVSDFTKASLLLYHNNETRQFKGPAGDELFYIAVGKNKAYSANATSLYQLHLSSKGTFSYSKIYTTTEKEESFSCLLMDRKENPIVIGTSLTMVLPGGQIVHQPLDYFANRAVLTKDDRLFIVSRAMHIYIYKLHPENPTGYLELIKHINWHDKNIEPRCLELDNAGHIWIGTRQRGLFTYSIIGEQLQLIRQLTEKDGLTENFIKTLYYDQAGNIWAGSPTGLDKITVQDKSISIENITRASNMYPDIQKVESDNHGNIWAVTTSGLAKIYHPAPSTPSAPPEIIFTKFMVANRELPVFTNKIVLKYNQNNLSFQVAVPSFFDERKTLFSYKLEESSNNNSTWTEPSTQSEISFPNLPHGNYRLYVRATFPNGKYAPLETIYSFEIQGPWWQKAWFRGLEFVAAMLVIIFLLRLYYRYKLQQQRLSLEKKQAIEKERTRIAIDMHDDMGAGLSRIKVLSETIKFENQKGVVNPSHLQKISAYSEEMMDKMGEIVWALNERNDSLKDLLSYTRAYAVDYLTNHNILCHFFSPPDPGEAFISGEVRRNIFLSVKEVLHNVIKHAEATGVDIIITTDNELSILIRDNGKGLKTDKANKFGNGLSNISKRMSEIGGIAEFESDCGTCVTLKLPKGYNFPYSTGKQ